MFKLVVISCSLKRLRAFVPYGWNNVRQRHLICVGFAERKSEFLETSFSLNFFPGAISKRFCDNYGIKTLSN